MEKSASRILLVDDEPALLKMVGSYLGRLGYDVTTVNSTEKAWCEIETAPQNFAVAVLDGTMPGLPMPELATRMLSTNPSLCILAASGYPLDISALEAAAPGRVAFLHKPFTPEMLAVAIRRMLGTQEEHV
jgi:two-component system, cell cycle sensor histidine kinase and response regulator CckA